VIRVPASPVDSPLLAVIVLSLGAPPELTDAVRSLLAQDAPAELIVVNSGGGDSAARLPAGGQGIRLISVDEVLWPGAARNLGIGASRAPFVAFLASDCIAEPGWVAARIDYHLQGASMVASAVVNAQRGNVAAALSHLLTYAGRDPDIHPDRAAPYGASYARWLFEVHGPFREDLRVGEDTEFRLRLEAFHTPVWGPKVRTVHRNPASLLALLRDRYVRGRRQGQYWPLQRRGGLVQRLRRGMRAAEADLSILPASAWPFVRLPRLQLGAALFAYELGYRSGRRQSAGGQGPEMLALAHMMARRWPKALDALRTAGQRPEGELVRPEPTLYAVICSSHMGAVAEARRLASAAVGQWPDHRGLSLHNARLAPPDGQAALAAWDGHIARFGSDHDALAGRVAALLQLDRLDHARAGCDALEAAYPYSAAGAWARVDIALAAREWDEALAALDALHARFGQPAALERKLTLLAALDRPEAAARAGGALAQVDLDGYLRAAPLLARVQGAPGLLAELAGRHAPRIAASDALLARYVGALNSNGAADAALALVEGTRLGPDQRRPLRLSSLLTAGRHAEAWELFKRGNRSIAPYGVATFSALLAAGLVVGDDETVARLVERASASARPDLAGEAALQRRRLSDLAALRSQLPSPAAEPVAIAASAGEPQRLLTQLRATHPRAFTDPTFCLDDALEVAAAIATAADRRKPLSLIRLGDGEGTLLPYRPELQAFAPIDRRSTAVVWWGADARALDVAPIARMLEAAVRDADILGVPDRHRLPHAGSAVAGDGLDGAAKNARGLLAVLDFALASVAPDTLLTSCHVHQSLSSWGLWDVLLPRLGPLSLVTCHGELAPALAARFGATIGTVHLVPPERKHAGRFASQVGGRHYPERFEQLRHELRRTGPGQVVLVAAGVLGKVYCQWIKAAGGVAIDVGSAADMWAGYYTRSTDENASYAVLPGAVDGLRRLARHDPRAAAIVG